MTRIEAINNLKRVGECLDMTYANEQEREEFEAINMAIKALEQENILEKIRSEIMMKDGLEEALEIIDKYREVTE